MSIEPPDFLKEKNIIWFQDHQFEPKYALTDYGIKYYKKERARIKKELKDNLNNEIIQKGITWKTIDPTIIQKKN